MFSSFTASSLPSPPRWQKTTNDAAKISISRRFRLCSAARTAAYNKSGQIARKPPDRPYN
nr:MAG TPA: hypothetical protein [Caudoviricetes sp.]